MKRRSFLFFIAAGALAKSLPANPNITSLAKPDEPRLCSHEADIGTVSAGCIKSGDGKMVIDLQKRTIEIWS